MEWNGVKNGMGSVITIDTDASSGTSCSMPRKLRLQYPGAIYHLMSRGDRRENIFEDDEDRHRVLKTLAEACEKTGWQVQS